ncbi:MAG TPA: TraR/DksA family transcriptional regulator [Polyangia bacterium]|nr:TraR/DksA family transcriptional regulator [Polyangia bacterium]
MPRPPALDAHRRRLLALKAEILNQGDLQIEPGRTDPTKVGTDDDAAPLTEMAQVIASKRNRSRSDELGKVLAALKRLDDAPEMFGLCTECEEPIPPRRLELMPYVELCVECQRGEDGPKGPATRRHLRDFR